MAYAGLGIPKREIESLYKELEDNEKVITALVNRAAEENVTFPLKETIDTLINEFKSAAKAHVDWQPSKVFVVLVLQLCKTGYRLVMYMHIILFSAQQIPFEIDSNSNSFQKLN